MKKIIYFLSICLLINCDGQSKKEVTKLDRQQIEKEMENYKEIPQEKQIRYILNINLYEVNDYEVIINGIKLYNKYDTGVFCILNPYLLKNGSAKIKLKFKRDKNLDIDNSFLDGKYRKLEFGNYWEDKNSNQHDLVSKILPFKKLDKPVKEFEQEWEMVIDKLPYELKGWSNSKVFKLEDSLLVEKKVVAFYQNLWNILNNGNTEEWMKLVEKRRQDTYVFEYTPKENIHKSYVKSKDDLLKNKGKMFPLEDYKLIISEDGKLLHLERIGKTPLPIKLHATTKAKGYSPLIGVDGGYFIRLHMPEGSNEFEIIRK